MDTLPQGTPSLEDILKVTTAVEQKYKLPNKVLFKMTGIESSYGKHMTSPAGAKGWFQFMPATAKAFGLDDPNDLAKSAEAAGKYLSTNMKRFNGDMATALVEYNGGHRAVKAYKNGKPFKESAGYLKKFGNIFTDIGKTSPKSPQEPASKPFYLQGEQQEQMQVSVGASGLQEEQQETANTHTNLDTFMNTGGLISESFKLDNSVYNFFKTEGLAEKDADFRWTDDNAKEYTQGIHQDHWDYVFQAQSDKEAKARRARVIKNMESERELAKYGIPAMVTRMGTSLFDLPTLLAVVPASGGAGALTVGSRLANAVRMGLVGGVSNVSYDYVADQYNPLRTDTDLIISGALGLALGGIGGALAPKVSRGSPKGNKLQSEMDKVMHWGTKKADEMQVEELRQSINLTPKGKAYVKAKTNNKQVIGTQELETPKTLKGDPKGVDTPQYSKYKRYGTKVLVLPDKIKKLPDLIAYTLKHTKDAGIRKLLGKISKSDELLDNLDFFPLRKGQASNTIGGKLNKRLPKGAAGAYLPQIRKSSTRETLALKDNSFFRGGDASGYNEITLVHELIHSRASKRQRAKGVPIIDKANAQMDKLLTEVKGVADKLGKTKEYSHILSNPRELLASGLTNPDFIKFLKENKTKGLQTPWQKFVKVLGNLLGFKSKDMSMLNKLLEVSEPLLADLKDIKAKATDFLPNSGSKADMDLAQAASDAELSPVYGWGLGLEHRLSGKNVATKTRALARKLLGTTVGYKDHGLVSANAWEDGLIYKEKFSIQLHKVADPSYERWFKESKRPWTQKAKAYEEFNEQVSTYIRSKDIPENTHKEVIITGNHIRKLLDDIVDDVNNPARESGGTQRGLVENYIVDPLTGKKELDGVKLAKSDTYLPRKHNVNKWNSMYQKYGKEAVEDYWANAYKSARPEVTAKQAKQWAKWYTRVVGDTNLNSVDNMQHGRTGDALEDMLSGYDTKGLKESLSRDGDFSELEVERIMAEMFNHEKPKGANPLSASLKHRNTVDELYTETWKNSDGSMVEIKMSDFTETNAMQLVEGYISSTSSSISLARHLDVYKPSDISRIIEKATEVKLGTALSPNDLKTQRADLKFSFDRIQGRAVEDFSKFGKSLAMWRSFNVMRLMGGAVWNQLNELAGIVGTMGWKATIGAIPMLGKLSRGKLDGKVANEMVDQIENLTGGVGSNFVKGMNFKASDDWVQNAGDTALNRFLDKTDNALQTMAKATLDYSGMTGVMVQQQRIHAIALVNHFVDIASGKASKSFLSEARLNHLGIGAKDKQGLLEDINKYVSKGKRIDTDRWAKESPETQAMFMRAIHRESRRVIQENDLPSMIPIMGKGLAQTMFQFMNFSIHGWNKAMLFGMNHKDASTLSTVMQGSLLASLTYMGRTYVSSANRSGEERTSFLNDRLSTEQIVANSFGRIAQASLLPNVIDTFSPVPIFSGMRTTSDVTGIGSNPTLGAVDSVISLKNILRNTASSEFQTTERDMRTWMGLLPMNNTMMIAPVLNAIANDYPSKATEE